MWRGVVGSFASELRGAQVVDFLIKAVRGVNTGGAGNIGSAGSTGSAGSAGSAVGNVGNAGNAGSAVGSSGGSGGGDGGGDGGDGGDGVRAMAVGRLMKESTRKGMVIRMQGVSPLCERMKIEEMCSSFGKVQHVVLQPKYHQAFVAMTTASAASLCTSMDGIMLYDCPLSVELVDDELAEGAGAAGAGAGAGGDALAGLGLGGGGWGGGDGL